MNKTFLVINLFIKTLVEFVIVATIISTIGAVVFIISYLAYSINNALDTYKSHINN